MDFIECLINAGAKVYKVGGSVRNSLYNNIHKTDKTIKDYDILVRLLPINDIIKLIEPYGFVKVVGIRFGVIKFKESGSGSGSDHEPEIDIAIPRIEKSTGTKYKDFEITSDHKISIKEDFSRRDATINAIGVRIFSKNDLYEVKFSYDNIIDPFNGISDIKNKIWKAVGDPNSRFKEDPTRIMRALRQCAELDLSLDDKTLKCIYSDYKLLEVIMKESVVRITEELVRLMKGSYSKILPILFESGISELLKIPNESQELLINNANIINTYNLRITIALLLSAHLDKNRESIRWTRNYELSAAPHFSKNDVSFINCVSEFAVPFNDSLNVIKNDRDIRILIRRLIQTCEKISPNRGHLFAGDLILYGRIVFGYDVIFLDRLITIHANERDIPMNTSQIKIKGDHLEIIWQKVVNNKIDKIPGKKIKEIKEYLFELIINETITNNEEELSMQAESYFMMKSLEDTT